MTPPDLFTENNVDEMLDVQPVSYHELSSRIGKAVEFMVAAMVEFGTRGAVNAPGLFA